MTFDIKILRSRHYDEKDLKTLFFICLMWPCIGTAQISTTPVGLQEIAAITTTVGEVITKDTSKSKSTVEVTAQSLAVASSKAVKIITSILALRDFSMNATYNSSTAVLEDTIRVSLLFFYENVSPTTLSSSCRLNFNSYTSVSSGNLVCCRSGLFQELFSAWTTFFVVNFIMH